MEGKDGVLSVSIGDRHSGRFLPVMINPLEFLEVSNLIVKKKKKFLFRK